MIKQKCAWQQKYFQMYEIESKTACNKFNWQESLHNGLGFIINANMGTFLFYCADGEKINAHQKH